MSHPNEPRPTSMLEAALSALVRLDADASNSTEGETASTLLDVAFVSPDLEVTR